MPEPTHYRLASAMEIDGEVKPAGSVITAEQLQALKPEAQAMLVGDEHVVPCDPPRVEPKVPSPFPRKPTKTKLE